MKKQTKSQCLNWKTSICMFLGLVMCFGVASCGGDDESVEPSKQNVPKRKKLVSIFTNGNYEYPSIEYDAYGRLSQIEETYKPYGGSYISDTYYYDFTYIGDTLKIFKRRSNNTHKFQGTYLLNAQGCLSKPLSYSDGVYVVANMQYLFQYNGDGYLTAFNGEEDNTGWVKSRKYVFSGDNLIRTIFKNDNNRTYLYSGDENKANIMFDDSMYSYSTPMENFTFDEIIRNGIPTILYNAGLLGKASKNLVSRSVHGKSESKFTYAFDSDGYPNYVEIEIYNSYGEKWKSRQFFLAYK